MLALTTDYRLYKVLEKRFKVNDSQVKEWGLLDAAADIGIEWSRDIYPQVE